MGRRTKIEYCDSTLNPLRGCAGCELWNGSTVKDCYAGKLVTHFSGQAMPAIFTHPVLYSGVPDQALGFTDLTWTQRPDKPWLNGYPRIIFWCDLSDPFTPYIYNLGVGRVANTLSWLEAIMMMDTPHINILLTKRPRRLRPFLSTIGGIPKNWWIGASVTSNSTRWRAEEIQDLRGSVYIHPSARLFLSLEPVLDDLNIGAYLDGIDWVGLGGMFGQGGIGDEERRLHTIVDAVQAANVPLFVKQLGSGFGAKAEAGFKGNDWTKWPDWARVREMPRLEVAP